ncbi:uncharacterized protein LOC126835986 isoform X1 [Adelges cooleyi]|uniref:uncharacterized protein LOC126835986 isoform X1 n=1 Tax=Adelges cooleyi TaxID=133065 RepID=UPI002180057F|nr:uncharacterized protein LOC126835986 isoform X1 [Adelges cooleyi]
MYLKIVILFFCVELYFLQCHCDEPTKDQKDIINSSLWGYGRSKGYRDDDWWSLDLQGVKDVIEIAAGKLNKPYEPISLEDLKEIGLRLRYSAEECKSYVKALLKFKYLNHEMERLIDDLYNEYSCDQQDGISFDGLKALLGRIPAGYNRNPPKFSYLEDKRTAVPYKLSKDFKYWYRNEIFCIIFEFFFPGSRVY